MDKNKMEQKEMNKKLIKQTFKDELKKSVNFKEIIIDSIFFFLAVILSEYFCEFLKIDSKFYKFMILFIFCIIFSIISNRIFNLLNFKNAKKNED